MVNNDVMNILSFMVATIIGFVCFGFFLIALIFIWGLISDIFKTK